VAAAMFWKQYAWFVVDAALHGWATGRVPDLALERTDIWIACEGRTVQVRPGGLDHARAGLGAHAPEFTGWFRTEVLKAHLEPVLEHLHDRTRAGRRLLWGSDRKSTRLNSSHVKISYA